jgi:tetratricopeptide (TPR) repeat protein
VGGASTVQGMAGVSFLKGLSLWPFVASSLGNGYFFVIAATILTFVLIGVCLLVKYTPYIVNDLENGTNSDLPELGLKLWVALLVILPVFFDAGPLWFVLWWFMIFWCYLNMFEKRIVYVLIALVFMSSLLAQVGAGLLTYADNNINREIFAIDKGIGTEKDRAAVQGWVQKHPSDAEPLNTRAQWEMAKGNYPAAVALLSRDLNLDPNNARYYNHLGIALAAMGKTGEAIKAFQNATTLAPGDIIYHYNLSRIYQSTFNFYEADKSIGKASKLDPEKVSYLLDQEAKAKSGKKYISEDMPLLDHIARQMRPSPELKAASDGLWAMAFGLFDRSRAIYAGLAVVLILFLMNHIPEDKFTKRCNRCGKHYYAGTTSASGYPMCLQCHWIEIKPKKSMNGIVASKTEDIKGFRVKNAKQAKKLELILPGLGSFYVNKTSKALTRLALFSCALVLILTGGRFIVSFIPSGIDYTLHARIAGVILAGLIYWRIFKTPPLKYGG